MATAVNRNKVRMPINRSKTDFSRVGGLNAHLKELREMIVLPLLHAKLYNHFHIKAPRGVIFYGPPGTGKTLVAGALATELNKDGNGKVAFYQRKGADILDKWVGESERKLRELFEQATRRRPAVIFFDELDGLAPQRSNRNDHVHSSVVATLLALMDGLDNKSGVIVIGATNRIDSIDPALRRPGRFDRELYFPLPSALARKEILEVHVQDWKHKPSSEFLSRISDMTPGCCGSDLQAICAEAVLCCLKRKYPLINQNPKIDIEVETLKVEEQDFLLARTNIVPTSQRTGSCYMRRLSTYIKPLLQRQVDNVVSHIHLLLPHFTQIRKYLVGSERYAGRLILKGTKQQRLNTHIVPAVLQTLEHMQSFVLDIPTHYKKIIQTAHRNTPSILVLSRVDEWWDCLENSGQIGIMTMLQDIHPGLPMLLIVSCSTDLPKMLQDYFRDNSGIVVKVTDPTSEERELFFAPLFFSSTGMSVYKILQNHLLKLKNGIPVDKTAKKCSMGPPLPRTKKGRKKTVERTSSKQDLKDKLHKVQDGKVTKRSEESKKYISASVAALEECCKNAIYYAREKLGGSLGHFVKTEKKSGQKSSWVPANDSANYKNYKNMMKDVGYSESQHRIKTIFLNKNIKEEPQKSRTNVSNTQKNCKRTDSKECRENMIDIYTLWKRVSHVTSDKLPVAQLELLYDTILASIYVHQDNYFDVIKGLEISLNKYEDVDF